MSVLDIIIPTMDNPRYLNPLLIQMLKTGVLGSGFGKLFIVNNGKADLKKDLDNLPGVTVLSPCKNLGWEGGLALALQECKSEFVCFQNDDITIPKVSYLVYEKMLIPFGDKNVAAVGPVSTTVTGIQSIFNPSSPDILSEVRWLIFFAVMIRRKYLDEVGGIDTTLPGGDDLDLSIRFRKAGKKLMVTPQAFLIHHGFATGTRVYGDGYSGVANGWNSPEMIDRTRQHLIRKHGFSSFSETFINSQIISQGDSFVVGEDVEKEIVLSMLNGDNRVAEFGCGGKKTVPHAIGVDRVPNGGTVPILHGPRGIGSVADVVADVTKPLPFKDGEFQTVIARHIIEHAVDLIATLKEWNRVIENGGKLIIATPDEDVVNGIPLDPTHCHAFNKESLSNLMTIMGFKPIDVKSSGNGISFVGCFQKVASVN